MHSDTKVCYNSCFVEYYKSSVTTCEPCHLSCSTCYGSGYEKCISCPEGAKLNVLTTHLGADAGNCVPKKGFYFIGIFDSVFRHGSSAMEPVSNKFSLTDPNNGEYDGSKPSYKRPTAFEKCDRTCFGCHGPLFTECTSCYDGWTLKLNNLSKENEKFPIG